MVVIFCFYIPIAAAVITMYSYYVFLSQIKKIVKKKGTNINK